VPQANGFLLRRIRPSFEGTVAKNFDFKFVPEFGQGAVSVQDAYFDAKFFPEFTVRAGKFTPPVGIERLQSSSATFFIETALPTNLVPLRDVGYEVYGNLGEGLLGYELGFFNGVADGVGGDTDVDDYKDIAVRIYSHPFQYSDFGFLQGLGVGFATISGDQFGTTTGTGANALVSSYKTPGQQSFFSYLTATPTLANGKHTRSSPQFFYSWGSLGILGEYVLSSQAVKNGANTATLSHNSWQTALVYALTGEVATNKGLKPFKELDPQNGTWGALELALRVSELTIDSQAFPLFSDITKSAQFAQSTGYGFNWYWNSNVKFSGTYEETFFTGGAAGGGNRETEKVFFTRLQLAY
jgi:phosphate-selective porin OprO/OprP